MTKIFEDRNRLHVREDEGVLMSPQMVPSSGGEVDKVYKKGRSRGAQISKLEIRGCLRVTRVFGKGGRGAAGSGSLSARMGIEHE